MNKSGISRLMASMLLLGVLFTQAGLNLMHAHQGLPQHDTATLCSSPENGTSCQVCALEGVASPLFAETSLFIFPEFTSASFIEVATAGLSLPVFDFSSGRAPPVC